jgi:hypothetical protein
MECCQANSVFLNTKSSKSFAQRTLALESSWHFVLSNTVKERGILAAYFFWNWSPFMSRSSLPNFKMTIFSLINLQKM